ncbi:CHP02436-containing protein [Gemmatirosa kalamazoonensis]|uniref:CHP02436-containing protein n=1 Tax=Gemmatirosa kalamazoonensis TaxID=861299 RepID=W0RFI9_9BACT|nr:four helix bundle protein [Gemmatirosa kalamazoonensis]AHG89566.1 CHP02436-containing protein [Gemmatirosa kalamazoonensis]
MGFGDFRDLEVWQRAMEQQRVSFVVARRLPHEEQYGLAAQIRSAANSVVANIVEGYASPTRANYRRYIGTSRSSNRELQGHLLTTISVGYLGEGDLRELLVLNQRVGQMLTKLYDRLGPRRE